MSDRMLWAWPWVDWQGSGGRTLAAILEYALLRRGRVIHSWGPAHSRPLNWERPSKFRGLRGMRRGLTTSQAGVLSGFRPACCSGQLSSPVSSPADRTELVRGPLTSLTSALSLSLPAVRLMPRRSRAQFGRRCRVAAPEVISPSPSCPAVSLATDAVSWLLSVEGLWVSHRLQTRLAGTLGPLGGESRLRTLCADRQDRQAGVLGVERRLGRQGRRDRETRRLQLGVTDAAKGPRDRRALCRRTDGPMDTRVGGRGERPEDIK